MKLAVKETAKKKYLKNIKKKKTHCKIRRVDYGDN